MSKNQLALIPLHEEYIIPMPDGHIGKRKLNLMINISADLVNNRADYPHCLEIKLNYGSEAEKLPDIGTISAFEVQIEDIEHALKVMYGAVIVAHIFIHHERRLVVMLKNVDLVVEYLAGLNASSSYPMKVFHKAYRHDGWCYADKFLSVGRAAVATSQAGVFPYFPTRH